MVRISRGGRLGYFSSLGIIAGIFLTRQAWQTLLSEFGNVYRDYMVRTRHLS